VRACAASRGDPHAGGANDIGAPLLAEGGGLGGLEPKAARLGFVAGTIPEDKLNAFERLLFRATRGNMFLKHASVGTVVDPTTTEKTEKAVFVVFFAGERARTKILKARICACRRPPPEQGFVTPRLRSSNRRRWS
jgi:V-type H+-transporting ATPase subunit a